MAQGPTCGKGTLVDTIKRSDGFIQKSYSCGHKANEIHVEDALNISEKVEVSILPR